MVWHYCVKDGCSPFSISVPQLRKGVKNFGGSHGSTEKSTKNRKDRCSEAILHLGLESMESTKGDVATSLSGSSGDHCE